jgi:hypothetical protein
MFEQLELNKFKMKKNTKKIIFGICFIFLISCKNSTPKTSIANNESNNTIIGIPISLDNLEVAQYDFPKNMNWADAEKFCDSLGNDWRLPNKDELNKLFQHKDRIGGFNGNWYWSSTVDENGDAWMQAFENKIEGTGFIGKTMPLYIRVVRSK